MAQSYLTWGMRKMGLFPYCQPLAWAVSRHLQPACMCVLGRGWEGGQKGWERGGEWEQNLQEKQCRCWQLDRCLLECNDICHFQSHSIAKNWTYDYTWMQRRLGYVVPGWGTISPYNFILWAMMGLATLNHWRTSTFHHKWFLLLPPESQ